MRNRIIHVKCTVTKGREGNVTLSVAEDNVRSDVLCMARILPFSSNWIPDGDVEFWGVSSTLKPFLLFEGLTLSWPKPVPDSHVVIAFDISLTIV